MIVNVSTGKPYNIYIESNPWQHIASILDAAKSNIVLIADANVVRLKVLDIADFLKNSGFKCDVHFLEQSGENIKTLQFFEKTARDILLMVNRKTTIVAIGGGTVGDLCGFIAGTVMRGIGFIQVPTTLLAMVDSSVGGKVAVNLGEYKNAIGMFYQPKAVLCDSSFLETVAKDEILSGYGEVLKYGIGFDADFCQYLLKNGIDDFDYIIAKSCEIKARVVSEDEFETNGVRELLNLGHTFGHAFELHTKKKHGICVAIGMIMALEFSKYIGCYDGKGFDDILNHYSAMGLQTRLLEVDPLDILSAMAHDKKNTQQSCIEIDGVIVKRTVRLILVEKIGKCFAKDVDTKTLYEFLLSIR